MATRDERADERGAIISFRASPELTAEIAAAAAAEGIALADVARRAVIRDLRRNGREVAA